ncbi:MAG: PhzF family phenazine biosynthesis isomerase [Deltaproteobacteria bacterium]|nr:PhzF family phenazine biosynthesis isomerase [Deltaproteobacteria bacterium]
MTKVVGLGGIFFRSADPKALSAWYAKHLGMPVEVWGGAPFPFREKDEPSRVGHTIWSPFSEDTSYFGPDPKRFMLNYRVDDLDAMLAALRAAGVAVDEKTDRSEYGYFGWATDPEGNRFELWEPPATERSGLTMYVVDAFTQEAFRGNPAAVAILEAFFDDPRLLAIARENNLSETAFLVPRPKSASQLAEYDLRWFTPTVEVDLCGHATLASAQVLFSRAAPELTELRFFTKSGPLTVTRGEAGALVMDFPSRPPEPRALHPGLSEALGLAPREVLVAGDYLVAVYPEAAQVAGLRPNFSALEALAPEIKGAIVTAPAGSDHPGVDFVSRFFAPAKGVSEDPVTGSAHTILGPYWAARLGKTKLQAQQLSARGGQMGLQVMGERVALSGHAVLTKTMVLHA